MARLRKGWACFKRPLFVVRGRESRVEALAWGWETLVMGRQRRFYWKQGWFRGPGVVLQVYALVVLVQPRISRWPALGDAIYLSSS